MLIRTTYAQGARRSFNKAGRLRRARKRERIAEERQERELRDIFYAVAAVKEGLEALPVTFKIQPIENGIVRIDTDIPVARRFRKPDEPLTITIDSLGIHFPLDYKKIAGPQNFNVPLRRRSKAMKAVKVLGNYAERITLKT